MKILLVDDEPIVLQGVSTIIRQFGNPNWKVVGQCSSTEESFGARLTVCGLKW